MTGNLILDWLILAVSLFNTFLLVWLGLTVILNAQIRSWGIWFAAAGLLFGALFFISHSAILGHDLNFFSPAFLFWWRIAWISISVLPLIWYVVILWYAGFWEHQNGGGAAVNRLQLRHKPWLYLALLTGILWIGLLLSFNPLPSFSQAGGIGLGLNLPANRVPVLILVFPFYTLLCTGLSIDALRRPEPSIRLMGDLARTRARRWLVSTSLLLLLIGLLVTGAMVWILARIQAGAIRPDAIGMIAWMDFLIESLIGSTVLFLGQAVVNYEVFTGKTLPRRGLAQYWKRAVILGAGFSLLIALSLSLRVLPIYIILLSMLVIVVFYALVGWRAFAERERFMQNLRPFISHQRLFQGVLEEDRTRIGDRDLSAPFTALFADVLEASRACLVPLGALAPLSGGPLIYPPGSDDAIPDPSEILLRLKSPNEIGVSLSPEENEGMVFAVPLWSERGLIGVLLLGEKQSGSIYTQEEIEIARAVGEHLIDTKATVEMARRLIGLQRQRLIQSQVLDRQSRRILHDEVLPLVHTLILTMTSPENGQDPLEMEMVSMLGAIHRQLSDLLHSAPSATVAKVSQLGFLEALRQLIEIDLAGAFDRVTWDIQPEAEEEFEELPAFVTEVIFFASREAIRNAARHGGRKVTRKQFCLSIGVKFQNGLIVVVEDNGVGFTFGEQVEVVGDDASRTKRESISPDARELERLMDSSNGQGLALHSTMMAVIGGVLSVESVAGQYTRIALELPESACRAWK